MTDSDPAGAAPNGAELVRVRPASGLGGESRVSRDWLERWPDDWIVIDEEPLAPQESEVAVATAATRTKPSGKPTNKEK